MQNETLLMDSRDDLLDQVKDFVKGKTGEFPGWCRAVAIVLLTEGRQPESVAAFIINAMNELKVLEEQLMMEDQDPLDEIGIQHNRSYLNLS